MKPFAPPLIFDPASIVCPTAAFAARAGFEDWAAVGDALRRNKPVAAPFVGVVATSSKSRVGPEAFYAALDALREEMPDLSFTIDQFGVALLARTP